ncbi:MAG: hypothetical protein AAF539_11030 [Planctomycetota bacterium]
MLDCGCDSAVCCGAPQNHPGFLNRMPPRRCGAIFQALDAVAGTVDQLAKGACECFKPHHRATCAAMPNATCDCHTCQSPSYVAPGHPSGGQPYALYPSDAPHASLHATEAPLLDASPHNSNTISPTPHLEPSMQTELPPVPQPMPMPQRTQEISRPGRLYDSLSNPFEDDSVQRMSKRRIAPAGFQDRSDDARFSDYYRR